MQETKVTQEDTKSETAESDLGSYYSVVYDTARMNAILLEAQATQGRIICSLASCLCMLPLRILTRVALWDPRRRVGQADAVNQVNKL